MRTAVVVGCLLASLLAAGPSAGEETVPQPLRGLTPPVGFGVTLFGTADGLPSALTVGPDGRIYATVTAPDFSRGWVMAWEDLGGIGGPGERVASDLRFPLGIAFGEDGTLYVTENSSFGGPDARGRITGLADTDGDGIFDERHTVLHNIPNGRHQTNGLRLGPDGWLYIANGNATDDGVECGPEPAESLECPNAEVQPWTGAILKADPGWRDVDLLADVVMEDAAYDAPDVIGYQEVLVAEGMRNIYGIDFSPRAPTQAYTVMNGADNPSSSEPIYRTDVADEVTVGTDPATGATRTRPSIDDMGFPSCLYDPHANPFPMLALGAHDHPGDLTPQDNPNPKVIEQFGRCAKNAVTRPLGFASGHAGATGLAFVPEGSFPERYHGDLLYGEWGSLWNVNGLEVTGHKIIHAEIDEDGTLGRQREFMTTPLPMDLAFDDEGVLYVADMTGGIYRVEHVADSPDPVTIRMVQGQFVPQVVTVPRRTTIEWVNDDAVARNVRGQRSIHADQPVLRSGTDIDSEGDVAPGARHRYTAGDLDGAWHYHSSTTSSDAAAMQGLLVVAPIDR